MTEQTPLAATGTKGRVRNAMWRDALAAHEAGRIRTFEVRGSDYLGGNSLLSTVMAPAWRKGRTRWSRPRSTCRTPGPTCATSPRCSPSAPPTSGPGGGPGTCRAPDPLTVRELAAIAAAPTGRAAKVRALPYAAVWAAGLFNPFVRELRETQHQFRRPFVLDSSAAQQTFGLEPHADRGLGALRPRQRHPLTPTAQSKRGALGAGALELEEVRVGGEQPRAVPQLHRVLAARDAGEHRAEERHAVDVDGRRADLVTRPGPCPGGATSQGVVVLGRVGGVGEVLGQARPPSAPRR